MAGSLAVDYINGDNIAGGFLAIGQTWQDVTASRSLGVTYTNTTGKPIIVLIRVTRGTTSTAGWGVSIDGSSVIPVCYNTNSNGGNTSVGNIVIPNGSTYNCSIITESASVQVWYELR